MTVLLDDLTETTSPTTTAQQPATTPAPPSNSIDEDETPGSDAPSEPSEQEASGDTSPSTTELLEPQRLVDFEPWERCLTDTDGEGAALAADLTVWLANDDTDYDPQFLSVELAHGASVDVVTDPQRADFDGDGILDVLQRFDIWDDRAGHFEGIRVCGTSRQLFPYVVASSNGNFNPRVVPENEGQPAGIVFGAVGAEETPSEFDSDGWLIRDFAKR